MGVKIDVSTWIIEVLTPPKRLDLYPDRKSVLFLHRSFRGHPSTTDVQDRLLRSTPVLEVGVIEGPDRPG